MLLVSFVFSSFSLLGMMRYERRHSFKAPLMPPIEEVDERSELKPLPRLPESIGSLSSTAEIEAEFLSGDYPNFTCKGLADLNQHMKISPSFRGRVLKEGSDVKYVVEDYGRDSYSIRVCCG